MQENIFRSLGAGTKFDPKRFGGDIAFFKKAKRSTAAGKGSTTVLPASLDFFGNGGFNGEKMGGTKPEEEQVAAVPEEAFPAGSGTDSESGDEGSVSEHDVSDAGSVSDEDREDVAVFAGKAQAETTDDADARKARITSLRRQKAEAVRAFRRRMRIHTKGGDVPDPVTTFEGMRPFVTSEQGKRAVQAALAAVEASAYKEPTPIQMQCIPAIAKGRDVLGVAPTGSGKTAAFLLPLLLRLAEAPVVSSIRALVLAPTRELCAQIHREAERLARGRRLRITLLDKSHVAAAAASAGGRDGSFSQRHDIVVATPLRMVALLATGAVDLAKLQALVLDEADRLLELGFVEQVDKVAEACKPAAACQRCMFSATMPPGIDALASSVLVSPLRVSVGTRGAGSEAVTQRLEFVGGEDGKLVAMRQLIREGFKPPAIVFVQSKERAQDLHRELAYDGVNIDAIHADRSRAQRDDIVKRFRTGSVWMLIATDVMARGVDFKGVNVVINYDFPQSAVSYIHRIGRTGRAGRTGSAVTFFTERDKPMLRSIANVIRLSGGDVPDWMLRIKGASRKEKQERARRAPRRARITTRPRQRKRQRKGAAGEDAAAGSDGGAKAGGE